MPSLSKINLELSAHPKDKALRARLFARLSRKEVAAQIRLLRERRGLTQVQFAKLCKMKQSAVSRIEQAEYSGWTYKILARIAERCDARLRIIFELAEDLSAQMKAENVNVGASLFEGALFRAEAPERALSSDQERTPSLKALSAKIMSQEVDRDNASEPQLEFGARRQFPRLPSLDAKSSEGQMCLS